MYIVGCVYVLCQTIFCETIPSESERERADENAVIDRDCGGVTCKVCTHKKTMKRDIFARAGWVTPNKISLR